MAKQRGDQAFTLKCRGNYGTRITLADDVLVVTRKGIDASLQDFADSTRTIPLAALVAVEWKKPGVAGGDGWVHLLLPDATEDPPGPQNQDSLCFAWGHRKDFQALHDYLVAKVAANRAQGVDPQVIPYDLPALTRTDSALIEQKRRNDEIENKRAKRGAPTAPDPVATLEKLAALRDAGVLTEEEFAVKKADLLSRM